jgi:hypothetical protein
MDRTHIVAFGCVLWGTMTAGVGLSRTLAQVMLRACACRRYLAAVYLQNICRFFGTERGVRGNVLEVGNGLMLIEASSWNLGEP